MAAPDFGTVNGFYKQYLGRDASQGEYDNWANGTFGATDAAGIEGQIKNSGEAQSYAQSQGGGAGGGLAPSPVPQNNAAGLNTATQPGGALLGSPTPTGGNLAGDVVNQQAAPVKYGSIQGFDDTKLNDPNYASAKYTPALRAFSAYLGSGGSVGQPYVNGVANPSSPGLGGAVAYAQAHGFANAKAVGDDSIDFGDGNGPVDVVQSNGSTWFNNQPSGGGAAAGPAVGGAALGAPAGGGGVPMAPAGVGGATSPNDPTIQAFRDALMKLMSDSSAPVSLSDPTLKGQSDAYHTAADQSAVRQREALAERMAFEGLNAGGQGSGAMDTANQGILQQTGQSEAGFDAGLVGNEVQQRRAALENALQIANSVGARTEAQQLQLQIANMDNQYRYASLNQNQGQFQDSTAFNYANLEAELNRQALLAGMGR